MRRRLRAGVSQVRQPVQASSRYSRVDEELVESARSLLQAARPGAGRIQRRRRILRTRHIREDTNDTSDDRGRLQRHHREAQHECVSGRHALGHARCRSSHFTPVRNSLWKLSSQILATDACDWMNLHANCKLSAVRPRVHVGTRVRAAADRSGSELKLARSRSIASLDFEDLQALMQRVARDRSGPISSRS